MISRRHCPKGRLGRPEDKPNAYFAKGGVNEVLSADDMKAALCEVFEKLGRRRKVPAGTNPAMSLGH